MRATVGILLALALASVAVPAASGAPDIVLLSIDTLRADRLGSYGSPRPTSPALDAQARRGVLFPQVITESSWTLPSHMTLFTGLHPTTHGVTLAQTRLPPEIPTLAEILSRSGYRTYGCTDGGFVGREFGFGRGFESYDDRRKELRLTLHRAKKFLSASDRQEPSFVFLHTYAVHCPYDPREEYSARLRTRPVEDHLETEGKCGNPDFNGMSLSPGQVKFLSDQYDAGIRAADDQLREFFRFLEERDGLENTLLVVLSDHGEEFYEHGRVGHERTLFLESLYVPLIFTGAGLPAVTLPGPVGLADVMPTVLELAGIEAPAMQGRSLVSRMRSGGKPPGHPRFSELDRDVRLRSLFLEDRHLIVNLDRGIVKLFDLASDPWEQNGTQGDDGGLESILEEHLERLASPERVATDRLSDEKLEELRALGYID